MIHDPRRAAHQAVDTDTDLCWPQHLLGVAGKVLHEVQHRGDLHRKGLGNRLARFARDQRRDLIHLGEQNLASGHD